MLLNISHFKGETHKQAIKKKKIKNKNTQKQTENKTLKAAHMNPRSTPYPLHFTYKYAFSVIHIQPFSIILIKVLHPF